MRECGELREWREKRDEAEAEPEEKAANGTDACTLEEQSDRLGQRGEMAREHGERREYTLVLTHSLINLLLQSQTLQERSVLCTGKRQNQLDPRQDASLSPEMEYFGEGCLQERKVN